MGGCYICQKHRAFGQNVSHSKRRTKRSFKANLRKVKVGIKIKLVCSSCLKKMDYIKV